MNKPVAVTYISSHRSHTKVALLYTNSVSAVAYATGLFIIPLFQLGPKAVRRNGRVEQVCTEVSYFVGRRYAKHELLDCPS
jgi:hypothetical protein